MSGTAQSDEPSGPLRFGPGGRFELRPAEYRLLVDGEPAALGGRALDLLIALAARPHQMLTKSELLEKVWRGLVVEENNLRVQVNALRRVLGEDAIATVPGRGYRLSVVLHAEPPAAAAVPPPATRIGAQRLFGRDADLARIAASLLDATRPVTLVGTPGVGKSSLARAVAMRWAGRSVWIDLAPLSRSDQVAGAVTRALGAPPDDSDPYAQVMQLAARDDPPLLLVIDNAEHLVEACAAWAVHLQGAPGLRLLATSQLPLAVGGEQVLRIEPLPVIDGEAARDGAQAMLIDRILTADGRFRATPEAQPLVDAICRQLDGLPLALEMAAARVPLMGLRAVHDALAERFALLSRGRRDSPARHRTVRDALAWSYGLLSPPDQRLFRMLGVFAGGFTLDLAVTLGTDEHVGRWEIVDGLASLVERSLVGVSGDDPPRYRLLETMRAYALEQLATDGAAEERSVRRRHAAALLALLAHGGSEDECLAEMENVRGAFLWAREHDLVLAAPLSAHAARVIGFTVWRREVTAWMLALRPVMQDVPGRALPLQTQAGWWSKMAYVLLVRRDPEGRAAAQRAVALWREVGDCAELLMALADLVRSIAEPGTELDQACAELHAAVAGATPTPRIELRVHGALAEAARVRQDYRALLTCREHELRLAREIGWTDMAQAAETNICAALIELGRHAEAAERARSLARCIEAGDGASNANLPWALYMLGEALLPLRAYDEARALVPRALLAEQPYGTAVAWRWIVALVAAEGRFEAAGRLVGYLERLWTMHRDGFDTEAEQLLGRISQAVCAELGSDTTAALAAEGASLSAAAAAVLAAGTTA